MKRISVEGLPPEPLAAAGVFHQHWLPHIEAALAQQQDVAVAFAPADHTHRAWRLGAIQGLARKYAPLRVNAVAGPDEGAIAATLDYLSRASGVTGQYLPTNGQSSGNEAH